MALLKTLTLPNGSAPTYHNIQSAHWHKKIQGITTTIFSYLNEDVRNTDPDNLGINTMRQQVYYMPSAFPLELDEIYEYLKTQPDFAEATNV